MVEKLTKIVLTKARLAIPAVTMLIACSLKTVSPSTRCTCVMIMLFNHRLDMPHLSGGWIMKHGTNTLYVAFIFVQCSYSSGCKHIEAVVVNKAVMYVAIASVLI